MERTSIAVVLAVFLPRAELPRDRYPKEIRYKGKGEKRGYEEHGR